MHVHKHHCEEGTGRAEIITEIVPSRLIMQLSMVMLLNSCSLHGILCTAGAPCAFRRQPLQCLTIYVFKQTIMLLFTTCTSEPVSLTTIQEFFPLSFVFVFIPAHNGWSLSLCRASGYLGNSKIGFMATSCLVPHDAALGHPVVSLFQRIAGHLCCSLFKYLHGSTAVWHSFDCCCTCTMWWPVDRCISVAVVVHEASTCWLGNCTNLIFGDFCTQASRVEMKIIQVAWEGTWCMQLVS